MHLKPLSETPDVSQEMRVREIMNIRQALNILTELVFEPQDGDMLTPNELERRRRMRFQGALTYIADLIKSLFRQSLAIGNDDRAMIEKAPTKAKWEEIRSGIGLLAEHPLWTTEFELSSRMKAVDAALSKNQDIEKSLGAVGLKLGFLVGADKLTNDWMGT